MADTKIGKIIHYYDKLGVAIVDLGSILKVGDKVKFVRDGKDLFEQDVSSMQFDHKSIDSASAGKSIGLKTEQKVHEGVEVYKV